MVWMGVGEKDGVDFFGINVELCQIGDKFVVNVIGFVGVGIYQYCIFVIVDQIGVNCNGFW